MCDLSMFLSPPEAPYIYIYMSHLLGECVKVIHPPNTIFVCLFCGAPVL